MCDVLIATSKEKLTHGPLIPISKRKLNYQALCVFIICLFLVLLKYHFQSAIYKLSAFIIYIISETCCLFIYYG